MSLYYFKTEDGFYVQGNDVFALVQNPVLHECEPNKVFDLSEKISKYFKMNITIVQVKHEIIGGTDYFPSKTFNTIPIGTKYAIVGDECREGGYRYEFVKISETQRIIVKSLVKSLLYQIKDCPIPYDEVVVLS